MTDPPNFAAARDHVLQEVVRFARTLRRSGCGVPANAALPATRALVEAGLDDRAGVRAALHATLVTDPRDTATFDEEFPAFWERLRAGLRATATVDDIEPPDDEAVGDRGGGINVTESVADAPADPSGGDGDDGDGEASVRSRQVAGSDAASEATEADEDGRTGTYSTVGDRTLVADERTAGDIDRAAVARLEAALATLSGRRWSRSGRGDAVDARRALRESLSTGGVALEVPTRERDQSAFRTTVLVDVSQSVLDAVDRGFLLAVLDALVADGRSVRVFFFDTEIREVTDAFAGQRGDPARALERSEVTWGGGTKIGDSLTALRRRWPDAVDRRTATLVVSDGLDVGEVDTLEREMAWVAAHSRAVVWLNPLAVSPRYEPTCRGMAAALPYVDALFAFGGNEDLDEIARQLRRHGPRGPVGYEYDFRDRGGVSP